MATRSSNLPGCWSTLRDDVLSNQNLARAGERLGLGHCINVNGGTSTVSSGMLATATAAVLGAVEKDGGHKAFVSVLERLHLLQHSLLAL